ncbi:MAG TPA: metallophosphoesterase family protein [Candidatus Binatia bacterium]|jgi:serine/threonine protein phosphatase 1
MSRYVVGDIHGCVDELRHLIETLPLARGDRLVFLGDYIDRGPDSSGVVSYLMSLQQQCDDIEFVFLKGNHEDMLLSYLGLNGQHGDMFLINGGRATLASYGLTPDRISPPHALSAIPAEHVRFFEGLKRYYSMDSFLCVHAGIHPKKSLAEQTDEELLWIRNTFIFNSHGLPYTVLFGHTPQPAVLYDLPYKVGLDTGLVYGNMLTCLDVDEKVLYQINRGRKNIHRTSVERRWNPSATLPR